MALSKRHLLFARNLSPDAVSQKEELKFVAAFLSLRGLESEERIKEVIAQQSCLDRFFKRQTSFRREMSGMLFWTLLKPIKRPFCTYS